jgi:phosphoglycerate dehydrogenase-like enzyme
VTKSEVVIWSDFPVKPAIREAWLARRWSPVLEPANLDELATAVECARVVLVDNYSFQQAALVLSRARAVEWIQLLSAGYENLLSWRPGRRVTFTGPGDSWSAAVADHAMALLLSLTRQLGAAVRLQMVRKWDDSLATGLSTLSGKAMLILGFGSIGQHIATRAQAFGMTVIAIARRRAGLIAGVRVHPSEQLHNLLPCADVIVMTLPMNSRTAGFFGEDQISRCRREAILVNVGRGATVDTVALRQALLEGRLAGAALDVTDPEPLPDSDPLWAMPNVLITPHVGGLGDSRSGARLAELVAENYRRFLDREPLAHVIRMETSDEPA